MKNRLIKLGDMRNMSIDNIIQLYKQGYSLEDGISNERIENLGPMISNLAISRGVINPQITPEYLIFKDGNTINAKNGLTGAIDFFGLDSLTVIQSVINNLTPGRIWQEKIVAKGIFTINNSSGYLQIPDHTVLELYGKFTASDSTKLMISTFGDDVELNNGIYDGNRISNDATVWSGYSTGTGIEQIINHGLPVTPTILELQNVDNNANPYINRSPDITNIYIIATNGLKYRWRVLV